MLIVHFILAIVIFFIQNWVGGRSYGVGYIKFSLLDEKDEAHSTNFVIKVFGPVIFLILFAAIFQFLDLQKINQDLIRTIYIYIAIRISMIFIYERQSIVNWVQILFYYSTILLLSQIIYNRFLNSVTDLLPDFSQIKNEVWLIILLYLYEIGNGKTRSQVSTESENTLTKVKGRKKKYIIRKHDQLNKKYGSLIDEIVNSNAELKVVIFSIMIIENFNRPRLLRWLENTWCTISGKEISQGIMQVKSTTPLSSIESIKIQAVYLKEKYLKYTGSGSEHLWSRVIKRHCPDKPFIQQTLFICKAIIDSFPDKSNYRRLMEEIISELFLVDFGDED